ncbi:protein FAR1-RELATED SEQUENCE 5-like [Arachis hypogaea]|uniref:Protein FAR1-RELATED SEQUENCE n=1 Tax=Arachis hypogaea TaxID=3818 RepID=A0A444ZD13_ARAHY|nr:hypothetical protein Ahy_B04g069598 [Arachis hypogaea]
MKSVIEQVFLEAHHRLCAWHPLRNATSNIGKPNFTRMFKDCILGDYEVGTFQKKRFEMVEKFGVADKRWVQDMYERRHSWATAHIRGRFFARFRTTSRCKGLHAVVSRYVKSRYNYTNFLRHFHRCLMFVRAKEVEADFECAKGDPVMTTNLKQLEQSAAENYTGAIFYLFVPILDRACAIKVVDSKDNGKDWHVVATSKMSKIRCTCMRIECFGVPCEHIIAVLCRWEQQEVPPWREVERRLEVVEIKLGLLLRLCYRQTPLRTHGSNDQEPPGQNEDDVGGI